MNHEIITNELNENEKLLINKVEKMEAEINKKDKELSSKDQEINNLKNELAYLKGILANRNKKIFGASSEKIDTDQLSFFNEAWKKATVNKWLAANCFGDYYTRTGLDLKQREMITFCFLYGQGGCEPQVMAHIQGNLNLGNDKAFLTNVVLQCVPYMGYPRSLNALACINKVED